MIKLISCQKTDQPGEGSWRSRIYWNSKNKLNSFPTFNVPKMLLFRFLWNHFHSATRAPTEPDHETYLQSPILSWPNVEGWTLLQLSDWRAISRKRLIAGLLDGYSWPGPYKCWSWTPVSRPGPRWPPLSWWSSTSKTGMNKFPLQEDSLCFM